MFTLNDFQVGDVLEMTSRMRTGEEVRVAEVTAINYGGHGEVTYCGHYGAYKRDLLPTGSGSFKPEAVGTKPFGFTCAVKKVGHISPRRGSDNGWMVRHPGYDLMY